MCSSHPHFFQSAEPEPAPAAADDPFGDAPVDLPETAFCDRLDDKSVPRSRNGFGHRGGFRGRGGGPRGQFRGGHRGNLRGRGGAATNNLKRSWTGKPVESPTGLLLDSYSLETLMATEFASDISIEELGDEMARAMGERDPRTVKSIVQACGMEKALALFEETRNVESHGGMMVSFSTKLTMR
ncbi:unnamed protein product [Cylicostephanus goldi]|uniref:Phosphorylated adapter RNA export protein n=1 Tax=Cylicostephanus goldi TaxID=71465 RepID=A0A3P6SIJ5_CYLGO|nr:unnamed protein product [Cylicostephanus goldi]